MFKSRTETLLATTAILLVFGLGGSYLYQNRDTLFAMNQNQDLRLDQIKMLQAHQSTRAQTEAQYKELQQELTMEMPDTDQRLEIQSQVNQILAEVGLEGRFQSINTKDPTLEDDFKIVSISINQIVCTPTELGQLLYRFEQDSQVMEVEYCSIDNQLSDTGQMGFGRTQRLQGNIMGDNGLLTVDLNISRLIDYRKGEAPKNKRKRT